MTRRGWCPTLYEPMPAGDGLLLRVKPPGGLLAANAALVLAAASRRHGNGIVGLTNRANLQFRGFDAEGATRFADIVAGLGLAVTDPEAERRRNVLIAPLAAEDSPARTIGRALEAMLAGDAGLAALPGKFGLVVDEAGPLSVHDAPGDILVQLQDNGVVAGPSNSEIGVSCRAAEAVSVVRRLIQVSLDHGTARRMRDFDAGAVVAAAGLVADRTVLRPPRRQPVGAGDGGFGLGIAFGQMEAASLERLAMLARDCGDGQLRLTPWRAVLIQGLSAEQAVTTGDGALISDPTDPARLVEACPGMPACPQASVTTRPDALELARLTGRSVHVSGCAKGCAHPGPSEITLVGRDGRYDLVRCGRADAHPQLRGLAIADIAARLTAEGLP